MGLRGSKTRLGCSRRRVGVRGVHRRQLVGDLPARPSNLQRRARRSRARGLVRAVPARPGVATALGIAAGDRGVSREPRHLDCLLPIPGHQRRIPRLRGPPRSVVPAPRPDPGEGLFPRPVRRALRDALHGDGGRLPRAQREPLGALAPGARAHHDPTAPTGVREPDARQSIDRPDARCAARRAGHRVTHGRRGAGSSSRPSCLA